VSDDSGSAPKIGFTLELQRADQGWRSGKIPLNQSGVFLTTVPLLPRKINEFSIELKEPGGLKVEVVPDSFKIIPGLPPGQVAIAARSYAVALVGNKSHVYIKKDAPLPLKTKRDVLYTTVPIRRGESKDVIVIPIIEGENSKADRNRHLQDLVIHGEKVRLDLPEGTEIEVYMEMDESRLLQVKAYVPMLDEEFPATVQPYAKLRSPDEIAKTLEGERERLKKIETQNLELKDADVDGKIAAIKAERLFEELEQCITLARRGDKDALAQIQDRILDLQARIDEAENLLAWPNLLRDTRAKMAELRQPVIQFGNETDKSRLRDIEEELESAISAKDTELLELRLSDLSGLYWAVLQRQPWFWPQLFRQCRDLASDSKDPALARRLVAQGDQALRGNDMETLRSVTSQLVGLLIKPPPPPVRPYGTTVKKGEV
jgi:molecular chaperone DnaK